MISDTCYSAIGRTTHQHLNNLRRQLGTGVDPAYDYTAMEQMQKQLANAGKQGLKQRSDRLHGEGGSTPASGLDLLKRTLKEVVGVGAGVEDDDSEDAEAAAINRRARSSPAQEREHREANRNTYAFMNSTRESLNRLDVENRFRAPPIGSYRPKPSLGLPRQPCHAFDPLEKTKSLKTVALEQEILRRTEEGLPVDDLKGTPVVSIELKEGIPENPFNKPKARNYQMHKDLPRPDLLKLAGIEFHDNSFTAGVLDGHNRTSEFARVPCFDFAKTSTAPDKPREYYFQPGQYAVKWDVARPKLELKNIPFEKAPSRKPLGEMINGKELKGGRPTMHLPDRSLSRPGANLGSAPLLLSTMPRTRDVNIGKCTKRKPPYEYVPPMYDESDPRIVESVMQNFNSYDAFEAIKATRPGLKPAANFKKHLTREQEIKRSRSYGVDINFTLQRNNLKQGPVSADTIEMDSLDNKPSLQPRIISRDLRTMAGREPSKQCVELPPRGRVDELSRVMNFERSLREGDSRAGAHNLSKLAGGISELRGTRSYDALSREDQLAASEIIHTPRAAAARGQ